MSLGPAWTGRVQNQLSADCLLVCSVALELCLALDFGACNPEMSLTCGVAAAGGDIEGQETIITYAPSPSGHSPRSPPDSAGTMPPSQPPRGRGH